MLSDIMSDIDIGKRIFVKGFSPETTENELRSYFERFGAVKESKVVRDRNGFSKGYAFITFESQEVADRVRDQESLEFEGKSLNIGKAVRRKSKRSFGKYYYHRQDVHDTSSHGSYYAFSTSDGSMYYSQMNQQPHFVLVPAYSPQMHYQSQSPYPQPSHSASQPIYTTTAVLGNSYLQPTPYSFSPGHSWNEVAAVPVNAAVVPKVHHQFPSENQTEIAVASTHAPPAQIVSLAIPEGNYVSDVGAVSGVGEVGLLLFTREVYLTLLYATM